MGDLGFVDRVEVLGDVYEVQTELVEVVEGRVRTVVFHHGRVVGMSTARLHGGGSGGAQGELQEMVRLHHELVLGAFTKRTCRLEERSLEGEPAATPRSPAWAVAAAEAHLEMPPIPEDPALADGLEVRRMYGELRRRIRDAAVQAGDRVGEWLDRAAEALERLRNEPRFGRIRLDEQARINVLAERIQAWRAAGRPPGPAADLHVDVELFCAYVWEINNRRDILEFDRRLLGWALATLESGGGARSIRKPLVWLRGRDVHLDDLLDRPEPPAPDEWRMHLERIRGTLR